MGEIPDNTMTKSYQCKTYVIDNEKHTSSSISYEIEINIFSAIVSLTI